MCQHSGRVGGLNTVEADLSGSPRSVYFDEIVKDTVGRPEILFSPP